MSPGMQMSDSMPMDHMHMGHMMMKPGPLGIPGTRMGSGTSWLPDATAMHAHHFAAGNWDLMLHYMAFVTYDHQASHRDIDGATQLNATDWVMGMASHDLGTGRALFRAMLSTEPATVGKAGYPLLLQTGETYRDKPLHDRQHPHDLFMELAALYDVPLSSNIGAEVYLAPAGEPAIGPVAFPHRPSAAGDPYAPLGHHWQDATHISYGVITTGIFTRAAKLEGSVFNGREPDETRTNVDFRTLDSYAGRLTVTPGAEWSLSASYAYLKSPEQAAPNISQHRLGASALLERPFGRDRHGSWSSAIIYGANLYSNSPRLSNSVDAETTIDLDGWNSVFGRLEYVNKDAADLAIPTVAPTRRFDVGAATIGYTRELAHAAGIGVGLGGVLTLDLTPATLEPYYGTRTPRGVGIFFRLRPRPPGS